MQPLAQAQGFMLALAGLGVPVSAWGALYPANTWLQVGPVAVLLPLAYRTLRRAPISDLSAACMTGFVLAAGGFYEIFEWSLTLALAPEAAGAYNGEQGDMFDAQKDMALAGLGALLALPFVRKAAWWKGRRHEKPLDDHRTGRRAGSNSV